MIADDKMNKNSFDVLLSASAADAIAKAVMLLLKTERLSIA